MKFPKITIETIGVVNNDRTDTRDDYWGEVVSTIELNPNLYQPSATQGLSDFSHIEVVFYMDQVKPEKIVSGTRHPRNLQQLPEVGILAQRGKNRPNTLAISRAEIVAVDGLTITVKGLDALNGTAIVDLKPYTQSFVPAAEKVREPEWMAYLMRNYYK